MGFNINLKLVPDDLESVLVGDLLLEPLNLFAGELDHLVGLDIHKVIMMLGTAGLVAGATVSKAVTLDQTMFGAIAFLVTRSFGRMVVVSVGVYLPAQAGVDMTRLAIGGVSRGGILAIAFAGMRPGLFKAAVNFSGGWLGQACTGYEALNQHLFRRGAAAGVPTLWLHGSNDPYYSIAHCAKNHAQFLEACGLGQFVALRAGHGLMFKPALWSALMDKYLDAQFPF